MAIKKEKIIMWLIWKLPKWVIYYSTIRLSAYATTGKYSNTNLTELNIMEAIERWKDKENK